MKKGHYLEAQALGWRVHEGGYLSAKLVGRPSLLVSSDYSLTPSPLPPSPTKPFWMSLLP